MNSSISEVTSGKRTFCADGLWVREGKELCREQVKRQLALFLAKELEMGPQYEIRFTEEEFGEVCDPMRGETRRVYGDELRWAEEEGVIKYRGIVMRAEVSTIDG